MAPTLGPDNSQSHTEAKLGGPAGADKGQVSGGIPSVNPFDGAADETTGEQAVAQYLGRQLEQLGYRTELTEVAPGRQNVIGHSPDGAGTHNGAGPTLALVGHTDTVGTTGHDDPFGGSVVDGRINGRGTCDMKGALAVFLEVAQVLAEADVGLAGQLVIAGLADEEHGMTGSQAVGAAGALADYAIVGEPTELAVCTAHKGQYAFPIRTSGVAVHSSIADQGVNAIESMVEVVSALVDYDRRLRSERGHPLCGTGPSTSARSAVEKWFRSCPTAARSKSIDVWSRGRRRPRSAGP